MDDRGQAQSEGRYLRRTTWRQLVDGIRALSKIPNTPDDLLGWKETVLKTKLEIWGAATFLAAAERYTDSCLSSFVTSNTSSLTADQQDPQACTRIIRAAEQWVAHFDNEPLPARMTAVDVGMFVELVRLCQTHQAMLNGRAGHGSIQLRLGELKMTAVNDLAANRPEYTADQWLNRANKYAQWGFPAWAYL